MRMLAGGANVGSLIAEIVVPAVAANPFLRLVLFEYLLVLHVFGELSYLSSWAFSTFATFHPAGDVLEASSLAILAYSLYISDHS